jgi:hypothetical protein
LFYFFSIPYLFNAYVQNHKVEEAPLEVEEAAPKAPLEGVIVLRIGLQHWCG